MKGLKYYLSIFVDEFNGRMTYHTSKLGAGPTSEDELRLVRDVGKCSPASDYLDSNTLNEMRDAFAKGFGDRDIHEFARAAKMGATTGKKWCVDILILAIQYAKENGASLIQEATIESLI